MHAAIQGEINLTRLSSHERNAQVVDAVDLASIQARNHYWRRLGAAVRTFGEFLCFFYCGYNIRETAIKNTAACMYVVTPLSQYTCEVDLLLHCRRNVLCMMYVFRQGSLP